MKQILRACVEEWRAAVRDPAARLMLLVATLAYSLLFPTPYLHQLARDLPVVVADPDGSALSRRLGRMLDATEQAAVIGTVTSAEEAERLVRTGRARAAIVIPADFERRVTRGERAVVGVLADASAFMNYSQLATGTAQAVGTLSAGIELRRLQAGGISDVVARRQREPLPLAMRALFNPSGGYGNAVVPAVIILVLQQTHLVGIGALAGARRGRGLRVASGAGAALGRLLAYAVLCCGNAALSYFLVYRVYHIPHQGEPAAALLFLLPFFLAVAALGLAISAVFRDRESALPVLLGTSIPALFLSGFSWPPEAMPAWLRALSQLLPSTQAMPAVLRVLQMDASLWQVRGPWFALWLLAGLYFALALRTTATGRTR